MLDNNVAEEILKDFGQLSALRSNEESHWQEIAERVIPSHVNTFSTNGLRSKGQKNTDLIFDSTATVALSRFASIMDSLLTPVNQKWHRLSTSNRYLNKDRQTRLWFEEATEILFRYRYSPRGNFISQNNQNFTSLGAYGTGAQFIDRLTTEPGLRYKCIPLGEIYFAENHQGIIDKASRRFMMTARQAYQKFKEKTPKEIIEKVKTNPENEFWFIHCVKPRHDYDPSRYDYKGKKFGSYYVSETGKKVVLEEGYQTFPYAISRYTQGPGETYGRSPIMEVLPAIKTLNEQKKTILTQGHRIVNPVLLAHDDGVIDGFSLAPGAINPGGVSEEGRLLIQALPTGRVDIGRDMMEDERAIIKDSLLSTLFQILVENPQMTATEVMERSKEKGMLLTPTVGRQQSEYLGPMIERELDLLSQMGLLPPMPPALLEAQGEFTIIYDSPLSRAQRAEEASGIMRTVESTLAIVNVTQNPEPLDHFNWDVIVPEISSIHGVPERFLRSMDEVQAIREGRAQEAQDQKMIQAAPAAAAMMKQGK